MIISFFILQHNKYFFLFEFSTKMLEDVCDVTESVAFRSNDQNSMQDLLNSPDKYYATHYVKCFNCYGQEQKQQNCEQCNSRNYISMSHPLSLLLDQVINKKLKVQPHIRQSVWCDLEKVQTIKQQQQQIDERKLLCDICSSQCQQYELYCKACQYFYVCKACSGKPFFHQHPLEKYIAQNDHSNKKRNQIVADGKITQKFFNLESQEQQVSTPWYIMKQGNSYFNDSGSENASAILARDAEFLDKIKQIKFNVQYNVNSEQRQSFEFGQPRQSIGMTGPKLCHNCYNCIQNYFSICMTCKQNNQIYQICDKCYESKKYDHDQRHQFCPTMFVSLNDEEHGIERFGQSDQQVDQLKQNQIQKDFRLVKKNSSIIKYMEEIQSPNLINTSTTCKSKSKLKYSQSIRTLSNPSEQSHIKKEVQEQSRVILQCDDIYSSMDIQEQLTNIHLVHKQSSNYQVNNSLQRPPSKSLFKQTFERDLDENQQQLTTPLYKYVESDGQCSAQNSSYEHLEDHKIKDIPKYNCSPFEQVQYQKLKQKIKQFLFVDYECDICKIQPIKNVRYHCKKCQNYDICERCYLNQKKMHEHSIFQKVDGVQMMIQKQLLQKKDLNKYDRKNLFRSKKQINEIKVKPTTQSLAVSNNLLRSTNLLAKRTKLV